MLLRLVLIVAVLAGLGRSGPARAADPPAELPAGGLIFVPDQQISLDQKEMVVGIDNVRIAYVLRNLTGADRTIQVSFPLPDIDATSIGDQELTLPLADPGNFIGFEAFIDGQPVSLDTQQRAIAFGIDVSGELVYHNVPLFPYTEGMAQTLRDLHEDVRRDFAERGMLRIDDDRVDPGWTLRTTMYWRQRFPVGKHVIVQARYRPVSATAPYSREMLDQIKSSHCLDAATIEKVLARAAEPGPPPTFTWYTYLLTSGQAWSPALPRLRVVIEKPDDKTIVGTCQKGFVADSPTTLEWTATDFSAENELHVVFIR